MVVLHTVRKVPKRLFGKEMPYRTSVRTRLAQRDGWVCHWCGKPITHRGDPNLLDNFATIDHLVRQRDGGTDDDSNLVLACRKCNNERHSLEDYQPLDSGEFSKIKSRAEFYLKSSKEKGVRRMAIDVLRLLDAFPKNTPPSL